MSISIPAFGSRSVAWKQQIRQGTRDDRTLNAITVSVPTSICDLALALPPETTHLVRQAQFEAIRFDQESASRGLGVSALLTQTESIASSRIEEIQSDSVNFLRATVGQKVSLDSIAMAAGLESLRFIIGHTEAHQPLILSTFLEGHRLLMRGDTSEERYAGAIRDVQNWIGGSQFSPRNADYIPPSPGDVPHAMSDLMSATQRTDLEPVVLAALVHAQFESVHPFTDGNGRMGRALISAVLKSQGLTTECVIPVASAFLGARTAYIESLESYRAGEAQPIITLTALAVLCAAQTGREFLPELEGILENWRHATAARAGSAPIRILPLLLRVDTLNVASVVSELKISAPAAAEGITVLEKLGIITEITGRSRDRYWVAPEIIELWSDYSAEVGSRFKKRV